MTPSQAAQEKHTSPRTPEERTPECDVCESPRPCLCDEYRAEAAASERSDPFVYYYETGDDQ